MYKIIHLKMSYKWLIIRSAVISGELWQYSVVCDTHRSEVNTIWKEKKRFITFNITQEKLNKCKCIVWVFCMTLCSCYAVSVVHKVITTANCHKELLTWVSLVYCLDRPVEQIAASRLNLWDCFHSGPALLKVSA